MNCMLQRIRDISAGIATSWWDRARFPAGAGFFSLASRPALGPTQPPIQLLQGGDFPGSNAAGGVKLTAHLQLVPRSGMVELYLHFPNCHGIMHRGSFMLPLYEATNIITFVTTAGRLVMFEWTSNDQRKQILMPKQKAKENENRN
jgi:hypothetical protein